MPKVNARPSHEVSCHNDIVTPVAALDSYEQKMCKVCHRFNGMVGNI